MGQRGPSRVAVGVAVGLSAGWLAASIGLHLWGLFGPAGRDVGDTALGAALMWCVGLVFVNIPAVFAGVAAVSTARAPGTSARLWWAARLAFWAALTGPIELLILVALVLVAAVLHLVTWVPN